MYVTNEKNMKQSVKKCEILEITIFEAFALYIII